MHPGSPKLGCTLTSSLPCARGTFSSCSTSHRNHLHLYILAFILVCGLVLFWLLFFFNKVIFPLIFVAIIILQACLTVAVLYQ